MGFRSYRVSKVKGFLGALTLGGKAPESKERGQIETILCTPGLLRIIENKRLPNTVTSKGDPSTLKPKEGGHDQVAAQHPRKPRALNPRSRALPKRMTISIPTAMQAILDSASHS